MRTNTMRSQLATLSWSTILLAIFLIVFGLNVLFNLTLIAPGIVYLNGAVAIAAGILLLVGR